ncbi:MBL fold metallo-hydrolase [Aureimonas flava]|uniref:MBL fold metallo-hydrolase n=1 Tax=Aureimonas flava TaxID=2320271 RepID=A0A3A1WRS2_9HYPH|nr:MBL fold metallo-hydrolase [Aureimonas flava]RIY03774.1 MBL fold metallo-hydrolase [Aureimonas flava]
MSRRLRLTVLGCGSSPGTPRITGDWGQCDPANPRNRRTRCSAMVELIDGDDVTRVVIDCGPDFREQMLAASVRRIDAVLITHPHADHIHGLDDLRGYVIDHRRLVDLYADRETYARLFEAFGYCFRTPPGSAYAPIVRHHEIQGGRSFEIDGPAGAITVHPYTQVHGSIHSLGFRIGPIAYSSDVSDFPSAAVEAISGAELLVVDALQYRPHPSHLSLDEALGWIDRLGVPRAVLTHMHTPLDYEAVRRSLPAHVEPAFDGMRIEFEL